jgi:hypothetical protein
MACSLGEASISIYWQNESGRQKIGCAPLDLIGERAGVGSSYFEGWDRVKQSQGPIARR